jgi:hypothetical protein
MNVYTSSPSNTAAVNPATGLHHHVVATGLGPLEVV